MTKQEKLNKLADCMEELSISFELVDEDHACYPEYHIEMEIKSNAGNDYIKLPDNYDHTDIRKLAALTNHGEASND